MSSINTKAAAKAGPPKPKSQRKRAARRAARIGGQDALIKAPVASGNVRVMRKPLVRPLKEGDVIVKHREYVQDIIGNAAFTATRLSINPGLITLFPWLCAMANRYESYKFRRLRFCFETSAPTSASGTVLIAVDYDSADATPTSKVQAMAYRNSTRSPFWSDVCHDSLLEDLHKVKSYYVRNSSLAANLDIKTYDVGTLFICTQGAGSDGSTIGELYVEYEVELITPQLNAFGSGESVSGLFVGTVNTAPFSNVSGGLPVTVEATGSTTSITTWTFSQPWEGVFAVRLVGTGLAGVVATGTATSSVSGDVINAAATAETCRVVINALALQTVILTVTNTTITTGNIIAGQGNFL